MFSDPKKNLEQIDFAPGMKVADFGSGAGYHTFIVAHAVGDTGAVYALDVQKDLLMTLKREAEKNHLFNIEIIWADFESTEPGKLKENLIDRVVVTNVLFQINNKEGLVREITRVMKPSGKVLVIDWSDSFGGIGPAQKDVFPKDTCQDIFEKAGLQFEKSIDAGLHHYGFVFKKV